MIPPLHSLAFSVTSSPGAFALILGSGVSRSAGIPTGWEITLELVRKLAALESAEPANPESWYWKKFGRAPDYAELLDAVTKTPSERQQLLRSYWEATGIERELGQKQPTIAHRRIADLISMNVIKVVVTTNFDRLLETALADLGITPTVISTVDQIKGALPLIHCRCCIVKVHGDYLDTRIRNTPAELSRYEPELNDLLDRIFDEFGAVYCGWSAEWDEALRAAIMRAPSRRFAAYWAVPGDLGDKARAILAHRAGIAIAIDNADAFFQELHDSVKALQEFSQPHPLSKELALANLKQYLTTPALALRLEELVLDEAERARQRIDGFGFPMSGGEKPDSASFTHRIKAYNSAIDTIVEMAAVGANWATREHSSVWKRALEIVHTPVDANNAYHAWVGAAHYPGMIVLYAAGLAAIGRENYQLVAELFAGESKLNNEFVTFTEQLAPAYAFNDDHGPRQLLDGYQNRAYAMNEYLHDHLRPLFKRIYPSDRAYDLAFDKFEILVSLSFLWRKSRSEANFWAPPGLWCLNRENREAIFAEIAKSLERKDDSPYANQLFSKDWADASNRLVLLKTKAPARFLAQYV
jgi:hypothetical protein